MNGIIPPSLSEFWLLMLLDNGLGGGDCRGFMALGRQCFWGACSDFWAVCAGFGVAADGQASCEISPIPQGQWGPLLVFITHEFGVTVSTVFWGPANETSGKQTPHELSISPWHLVSA
jgi:hypothetical protein